LTLTGPWACGILRPAAEFKANMDAMIREVKAEPLAMGVSKIMVAGEPEFLTEQERREKGIPLSDAVVGDLTKLGAGVRVPFQTWPSGRRRWAMADTLYMLTACEAALRLRERTLSSEGLAAACLDRIADLEPTVQAWAFLDPEYALAQARARDRERDDGLPLGPLHGIPVGVKDIFDTADMPTENGTVLHAGRRPVQDAMSVALLRAAGAVILGKTVTTELAVFHPGKTRNPHDPTRTPGGSSSGSAAAVAAAMVPLSIGSQTNGSVIRPAAYCGVVGYKPTQGLISQVGDLLQSHHLDHVGVFARSLEDAALLAEALMVYDARDPNMRPTAHPTLQAALATQPPTPPRLAFVRTPFWDRAEADTQSRFEALATRLGTQVEAVDLPPAFAAAADIHRTIMEADFAVSFATEYDRGKDRLSPILREMIERGQRTSAADYRRALEAVAPLRQVLQALFARYDAILTPATTGEAPGPESTGSPIFCTIWTLCGQPALTLPLLSGPSGLPLGVQLVGARQDDARLFRTAHWVTQRLGSCG
jgi:Asp-tRNA(Asn)/Glu-tRNA(Gln) amidotransferase A subunit family amidase